MINKGREMKETKKFFILLIAIGFFLTGCGKSSNDAFKDALYDLYKKDINGAIANFEESAIKDPEKLEAYIELSKLYIQIGDIESTIRNLEMILELQPIQAEANLQLAKLYFSQKYFSKAKDQVQSGLENAGSNDQLRKMLTILNIQIDTIVKETENLTRLETLFNDNPSDVSAGLQLLEIYKAQVKKLVLAKKAGATQPYLERSEQVRNQILESIESLSAKEKSSQKIQSELGDVFYIACDEQLLLGNIPEGMTFLEKAIEKSPNNGKYYFILAQLYGKTGEDKKKVIKTTEKAVKLNPEMGDYRIALAGFYANAKRLKDARKQLEAALKDKNLSKQRQQFAKQRLKALEENLSSSK